MVVYAPAKQRPLYVGLSNTVTAVVSLVAPISSGAIVQHFGYSALFVVSLTMALATLFVTIRYLCTKPVAAPAIVSVGTA